jgi:DNA-binding transcriptional regulator YiaG
VDAWIEDDHLVVLASSFARLRIPLAKLAPHLGRDRDQVRAFEIDEDGAFLYWAGADAHLGLDQLAAVVDPTFAIAMQRKSSEFNRQYGKAIRALRAESGVTQAAIAGVTARHLRRIECGQLGPTSAVLRSLAAAHRMDVTRYLAEVARRLTG